MPAFDYTSGNPSNLTAGSNASMADIQGPFTDLKGRLNGTNGTLDETNVPNLAAAFTTYERLERTAGQTVQATGTLLLPVAAVLAANISAVPVNTGNAAPTDLLIDLDPADYNANSRLTKLRLRAAISVNGTAPTANYTYGLYPIATVGGGTSSPIVVSVGTVVTGSTVTINAPAANLITRATGADFNFPAAGSYLIGVVPSAVAGTNSIQHHIVQLHMRQV